MKKILLQILGFGCSAIILLAVGFSGGVLFDRAIYQPKVAKVSVPTNAEGDFQLISQAWQTILDNYVDQGAIKEKTLAYGAISGMVEALGDTGHSRFMSPEMLKSENQQLAGSFEGIGATMEYKDNHAVVIAPFDGSPAQKAGVLPGDVILKVDGVDMTGLPLTDVISHIVGPAGTKVTITVQNPADNKVREMTITRAVIKLQIVTWVMVPGTTVAYLHIGSFSSGVTDSLKEALTAIKCQGATGLILDLRNNPGGLVPEAIGVASQFLKEGQVVFQEKDAQGKIKENPVQKGGLATDIPMVVLINQGSASASEIVSGALQDYARGELIGETTFGTGTVLNRFSLSDKSAMLLATEEWLTSKGRLIWHAGIVPDKKVTQALDVLPLGADVLRTMSAADVQTTKDAQFLQALQDLLAAIKAGK